MSGNKKTGAVNSRHPLLVLEDALSFCSVGKFHIRLLIASLVSTFAYSLVTSTSSYLLPYAECDLNMSLIEKGLLNAGPFIGIVCAVLPSSFFIDVFGRKKLLITGHLAIFIFTVIEASSQNYWNLLLMKVLQGASVILCLVAMMSTVADLTFKELRNSMAMLIVSFGPLALIGGALVSWGLLPHQDWHFVVWKGYFEIHSWNIYLYVCSAFSLLATILFYRIPESPRYLLFQGKDSEALEILKGVYSENTNRDKDTFPIKKLGSLGILCTNSINLKTRVNQYLSLMKQLFQKPIVYQMMLLSFFSFVTHFVYSVRLWYPQLSTIIENYRKEHGNTERFCSILNDYTVKLYTDMKNVTLSEFCVPTLSGPETYINMIVVGLTTFFAINITGYLVDRVGLKLIQFFLFVFSAVCLRALYFSSSALHIALLVSAVCGFLQASLGLQKTVLTDLFPVTLKALGLSIVIMWGRAGALLGNIMFPVLLQIDCSVALLCFSIPILCTSGLTYFIPVKDNLPHNSLP